MTQFGRFSVLEPRKKAGMAENRGMCESGRNGVEDWESEPQDQRTETVKPTRILLLLHSFILYLLINI